MKIDLVNLDFIETRVKSMAYDVEIFLGKEQTVTSLYRINDKGVHGTLPLRGIDLRCHDEIVGKQVEDYINSRWQYDPARPEKKCCMYHDVGKGAHIHLQSHPNTRRIV